MSRPYYDAAMKTLEGAHKACMEANNRLLQIGEACKVNIGGSPTGMSHGPFSGVNEALGIVANLEEECAAQAKRIAELEGQREVDAGLAEGRNLVIKQLEARNAKLVEALKPFARMADMYDLSWSDSDELELIFGDDGMLMDKVTIAQFRRALSAIENKGE